MTPAQGWHAQIEKCKQFFWCRQCDSHMTSGDDWPMSQEDPNTMAGALYKLGAKKLPQKFRKSHWCVPFTATFSKRRKIGALWSERCDNQIRSALHNQLRLFVQAHSSIGIYHKWQNWSATPLACWDSGQSLAILNDMCAHTLPPRVSLIVIVTPKGVLLLAMCDASATREGLWASSKGNLPVEKYMWQASLQLETYQLSHW